MRKLYIDREVVDQALTALMYMHIEKCDYMRLNNLGNPLREDAARLALPAVDALQAALSAAAEPVNARLWSAQALEWAKQQANELDAVLPQYTPIPAPAVPVQDESFGSKAQQQADAEFPSAVPDAAKPETQGERAELAAQLQEMADRQFHSPRPIYHTVGLMRRAAALLAAGPAMPAPHECKTEAERTAYAFGWWKALEHARSAGPAHVEPLTDDRKHGLWKTWSMSPCEDDWHSRREAERMEAAYKAGIRDGERAHGIGKDQAS